METICVNCKKKGHKQWYPTPVPVLERIISRRVAGIWKTHPDGVPLYFGPTNPNYGIAKNLAYNLQYIECLALQLDVLALSGVLYVQTVKTFIMHVGSVMEAIFKYEVAKVSPESSKFSRLIPKAKENALFGSEPDLYEGVEAVRVMREKVHLHLAELSHQTDYKYFDHDKLAEAKIAFRRLIEPYFSLTDEEIQKLFSYLVGLSAPRK